MDHWETSVPAPHKPGGDGRVQCQQVEGFIKEAKEVLGEWEEAHPREITA